MGSVALFCLDSGRTRCALELRSDTSGQGRMSREDTRSFAAEKLDENVNPGGLLRSDQRLKITLLLKVFLDRNGILKLCCKAI